MDHEAIAKALCAAHPHLSFTTVLEFLQNLGADLPTIIAVLGTLRGLLPPAPAV